MSKTTRPSHNPRAADVIFVGAAMGAVRDALGTRNDSLTSRHLRSIDDLLAVIDDCHVSCVVVDQSRPTESRGLKLALLAAANRIDHLIVLAAPKERHEIEAIHGVHKVIRMPAAPKSIVDAVLDYMNRVVDNEKPADTPQSRPAPCAPAKNGHKPATDPGNATPGARTKGAPRQGPAGGFAKQLAEALVVARQQTGAGLWQRFMPLVSILYKKLAMVVLAALFALFLSYGSIVVFFLTSSSWSMPIELSSGHELVVRAEKDLGEMRVRQNQVRQALESAQSLLEIAARDKRDAQLRLELSKRTIELELRQQHDLLRETKQQILRLKRIIADFRNTNGNGTFARNLEAAYAKRMITRRSLDAGTLAILESLHRMAVVSHELAIKEIEKDRIDARVEFLKSLQVQIDKPEIRTLSSAGADLVELARQVIKDRNTISQSEQTIAVKTAEVSHLRDSLAVVTGNINSLLSTPVGRAITSPVTVVFVPYENDANFDSGRALYRCAMLVLFCSRAGETGDAIPGETNSVHPLFGKPLRGTFVEAVLNDKDNAKEELLHAGRPPLFL